MKMRLTSKFTIIALLAVSAASALGQAAAPAVDIGAKVDEYMNARLDAKGYGGAVLIMKDGKAIAAKGFGFADAEAKAPIKADTKFRIGSVTKQFTAALILMLQEDGKPRAAYYGCGYGGCYVRRVVPSPLGPRWRLVNRCF